MSPRSAQHDGRRITLPSGRRLGYSEWGDTGGRPVVYFHGGLSSRLDIAFADGVCARLGVRLIAVDRPGIGLSDRHPRRQLLDWPADVAELADQIGVGRFSVLGWSAGGPHVLACAVAIPQRLAAAATSGGMAPLEHDDNVNDLGFQADRVLFPLSRRAPRLAAAGLWLAGRAPAAVVKWSLVHELGRLGAHADRQVVSRLSRAEASGFFYEALRNGAGGTVDDYRVLGDPWGFRLEHVDFKVTLFHGAEDRVEPLPHAEAMATRLPQADLQVVPGAGHFLLHRHLDQVLTTLIGA
jgi:pimeloyl-ACP methyl ester carboxylesterase